jgi:hypothetical protein
MGRPPIGKQAMSGAERTRRYREKFRHDKPVTKQTQPDAALVKELKQAKTRNVELEAENLALVTKLKAATAGGQDAPARTARALAQAKATPKTSQLEPATLLSMTAQQKLDVYKRKLDAEFEARTREECRRWLNEVSLPQYRKELIELERSITNRRGIMDGITYKKILTCLHVERLIQLLGIPLSKLDTNLQRRYNEAFQLFTTLEKRVLDEKESPTTFRKMPRTYEELMAMRAKVQAQRRAKRGTMVRR